MDEALWQEAQERLVTELLLKIALGEGKDTPTPKNLSDVYVIVSEPNKNGERTFRILPPYTQISPNKKELGILKTAAARSADRSPPTVSNTL